MALSEDDRREIREEIRAGFKEFFAEQDITVAQHVSDHRRLQGLWEGIKVVRMACLVALATTGVTGLLGLLWVALKSGGGN